jgi:hypothetical protein
MVELQVLIGLGVVVAVGVVLWRQRQLCQRQIARMIQQEAAESQVQVTAVDVPPLANFPTAEDALDIVLAPKAPPKKASKKRAPRKAAKKTR